MALLSASGSAAGSGPATEERQELLSALERLLLTGEPADVDHGDGQLLQAAVDAALARGDGEIAQLAGRAAAPLVARVSPPVASTEDLPSLRFEIRPVLRLQRPTRYRAELQVSIDGGDLVPIGTITSSAGSRVDRLPAIAVSPGTHHLRIRARIVYDFPTLPPELRDLPELVYAIYAPGRMGTDAGMFLRSARTVPAYSLDPGLPSVPFDEWLRGSLARHGRQAAARIAWSAAYCEERTTAAGASPRSGTLCAVARFEVDDRHAGVGEAWIRTGRVELDQGSIRWQAEAPRFEGLVLRGAHIRRAGPFRRSSSGIRRRGRRAICRFLPKISRWSAADRLRMWR